MSKDALIGMVNNALLLLAMSFIYDALTSRYRLQADRRMQAGVGAMLGLLGVVIILTPWTFEPGLFFDTRSVLLSVSGLFFGPLPTLIAMALTAAFRFSLGGAIIPGIGVIFATGTVGLAWRHYRRRPVEEITWWELYLFGVVVHLAMFGMILTLPWPTAARVLGHVGLPIILIYPVATALLGKLMVFRLRREKISAELQESEGRYRALFENSHAVMLLTDPADGSIIDANPEAAKFYGCERQELRRKKISEINILSTAEVQAEMAAAEADNRRYLLFRHRLADGTVRDVEVFSGPLVLAGKSLLFSIVHDATERRKAETGLRRAQFCLDNAAVGIFRLDERSGRIVEANAQACQSLGYTPDELYALQVFDIDPQFTPELWRKHREALPADGFKTFETMHRRKDGSLFPVEVTISTHRYEGQSLSYSFVQDISDRKTYERQLVHLATHDELTGLANRNLLYDRLEQSIHYANRSQRLVAILLIDLDRFKVINDSLGHAAGDALLCIVARRLLDGVHEADTVARVGGDEFVIVLADVAEEEHVGLFAEMIVGRLIRPFTLDERPITVTPSIGISLYPRDGETSEMLLRHADIAMYRAKEEGNSFCFYAAGMNRRIMETLELEADLREAVAQNALALYYQPKVELATGRICGCEALLRWQHPQRGMLAPGSFIHLAEETGLILPIGQWVMATACAQVRQWQALGLPPIPVAVNLSARQFHTGDLLKNVQEIISAAGLSPQLLELELTESMIMRDPEATRRTLLQLKALGVRLALDDFGTGYSSLDYLRRFPFDCLKIDRSFIHDVATDRSAAAVARSIVAIAHSLGLRTVAEGVETRAQLDFLVQCNCDSYQGFYFSQPLPAPLFGELLQKGPGAAVAPTGTAPGQRSFQGSSQ